VLRALDALVLCSDHEGLPMILLEAMCLQVPIVARAVGGIPEVIVHNTSGILVDSASPAALAQACQEVLFDKMSAARITLAAARLVADKFSAQAAAAATARLYFDLVAGVPALAASKAGAP
jgi:glycosyltransferase involved in cell wall biosynthesis